MTAVKEDKENVVELLLGFGADQEMRTNNGLKAVDLAFEMKHFKLMNLLSTAGKFFKIYFTIPTSIQ